MQKTLYPLLLGIVAPLALIAHAAARGSSASDTEKRSMISLALVLTLAWTLRSDKSRASALNQAFAAIALAGAGGLWVAAALKDDSQITADGSADDASDLLITAEGMTPEELDAFTDAFSNPMMVYPPKQEPALTGRPEPIFAAEPAQPTAAAPPVVRQSSQQITQARASDILNKIARGLGDAVNQGRAATAGFWESAAVAGHGWVGIVLLDFAKNDAAGLKLIQGLDVVRTGQDTFGIHLPIAEPPPVVDVTAVVEFAAKQGS